MMPCLRAALMWWVAPGSTGEIHTSRPSGQEMTWALTPWRWCFPE